MNNKVVAVLALSLVLAGFLVTLCLLFIGDRVERLVGLGVATAGYVALMICFLGCAMGWASVKHPLGTVAVLLAVILLGGYFLHYAFGGTPAGRNRAPASQPVEGER